MSEDYTLFAQLTPLSRAGGPVNSLLFIKDATLLVSGGDDQVVRVWDVGSGECLQELRDPQWGQITALSWLPEQLEKPPVLFIGTGRGVVSLYPFANERNKVAVFTGSAALSGDGSTKAVYNLSSGDFDVYHPTNSLTPTTLSIPTGTRLIKQCAFAEDGRTLICGGDNGTVHVFKLGEIVEHKFLSTEGSLDTFYAVTTASTLDYHFVAGGESEEPAAIFVWRKPTEKRAAENKRIRKLQADKETVAHQAAKKEMETKALKARLATMEEEMLRTRKRSSNTWLLAGVLVGAVFLVLRLTYLDDANLHFYSSTLADRFSSQVE
ncbi:WD40-repeat-containing domain protein [Mycena metata]|uniref:WD40-repeat-containing domain protein n=1 Tax=Mycena metata TaxID=1033252 RepID=A0AAD7H4J5_9AGAR|nr:WD40-repeat-containing domain protein [Mycena metata]